MSRPSTPRPEKFVTVAGGRGSAEDKAGRTRKERRRALLQPAPLRADELETLRGWLIGNVALRPAEAQRLVGHAVDRGQLIDEPALHWRAVKARIAGDANWAPMGFKLVLD
ncbi:hypothetical protein [Roseateles sp.]|uniref:hypothetical protein n=1 Tax=Roseateles sp. TaxID=1971397 RepID=UPI0039E8F3EF